MFVDGIMKAVEENQQRSMTKLEKEYWSNREGDRNPIHISEGVTSTEGEADLSSKKTNYMYDAQWATRLSCPRDTIFYNLLSQLRSEDTCTFPLTFACFCLIVFHADREFFLEEYLFHQQLVERSSYIWRYLLLIILVASFGTFVLGTMTLILADDIFALVFILLGAFLCKSGCNY